jgi:hypothetical protein
MENANIRKDITKFREETSHHIKCLKEMFKELPQTDRIKDDFEREVSTFLDFHQSPIYVNKRWWKGFNGWKLITSVIWKTPDIDGGVDYPLIRQITVQRWFHGNAKVTLVETYNVDYPEDNEDFLKEIEQAKDMCDEGK